ncbi:unnamed protein product [Arabidopsis halleri]
MIMMTPFFSHINCFWVCKMHNGGRKILNLFFENRLRRHYLK